MDLIGGRFEQSHPSQTLGSRRSVLAIFQSVFQACPDKPNPDDPQPRSNDFHRFNFRASPFRREGQRRSSYRHDFAG